ncbi:hypothetical protein SCLCIDRAFT_1211945 [Scleroderma citrinum Foug A]|uniref:Uncharacterized protein n=1 Tax=Scleroderma citrinum Foug A TaxID=1036808 RepID=A0A0C2ZWU6_9AGAM|nr:hypothetical protein SCLCIDRAFT_1211945 [Scleroderma citrinum Foug A]
MFLSRTVAGEVCMEAKSNEYAYRALKALDRAGDLLFSLPTLVTDLIKLFVKTRSITTSYTVNILRQLYTDFPTSDPTVRTVMLLTVFLFDGIIPPSAPLATARSKLETLNLLPLTRQDLVNVMTNPFIEKPQILLEYAKEDMDMSPKMIKELVQEVAVACLEVGSKGKTIRRLVESNALQDILADAAVQRFTLSVADLPPSEDEQACTAYEAPLCRDFNNLKGNRGNSNSVSSQHNSAGVSQYSSHNEPGPASIVESSREMDDDTVIADGVQQDAMSVTEDFDLGTIGQDSLSVMIRQDEMAPTRSRRRSFYYSFYGADTTAKLGYPVEFLQVGRWVKETYPVESPIMAVFLTHAIINNNNTLLHLYLASAAPSYSSSMVHVPITLKHFKLLAHLGRAPNFCLYHEIELGAEFYFSEEDYLSKQTPGVETRRPGKHKSRADVKKETSPASVSCSLHQIDPSRSASFASTSPRISRRRSRRSTTAMTTSYVIPDSDDERIVEDDDENAMMALMSMQAKKRRVESNLQRWIKHLSALLTEEQRKYKEKRRRLEKATPADGKLRVTKNEFHKSLTTHLRLLRKVDLDKRKQLYGPDVAEEDYSDDEDDEEYRYQKSRPSKRRRTNITS